MQSMIRIRGLTKRFGGLAAVDNVGLEIRKGELFGLLGPNGAGKTTMIRMLSTLITPSSGSARVCGHDIRKRRDEVRRCIGIVFQDPAVDDELTGRENLDFHARMYGMEKSLREKRIIEVLKLVDLEERKDVLVKKYSGGMRRRLEIARGLMHYPEVLFLDEPTLGLDPQTRRRIWEYIRALNRREGITIILTTHYMEEADYLCGRVGIIDRGKILVVGSPNQLRNRVGRDVITMHLGDPGKLSGLLKGMGWKGRMKIHDNALTLSVSGGEEKIPRLMALADKSGIGVKSISLRKPTLEDVFLHYTGRTIREKEAETGEAFRMHLRARGRGP